MSDIRNDVSNKAEELKGQAKEKVGGVTGDEQLEAEGRGDQAESKIKQIGEDAKDFVEDAVDKVKDMFKKKD